MTRKHNTTTMKYCNVLVTSTTKAVLDFDSGLLHVDTNRDGITEFSVSPMSVELSSSQPIKPLQTGTGMVYEVILTNKGEKSTFALDVDTPLPWSYSLSCDTVTLDMNESATILLTVTIPQEIPLKDYIICFEAISLEDSQMTANLELIASSKSEVVAVDMTVTCEEKGVTLEAFVSNLGLTDAEDVKVQFFNGPPSVNDLLGEQIITVPSGEIITASINCTLPEGTYTFYVIVDPENLISESCESNNGLQAQYLLDRTPPEAEIFFDPGIGKVALRGVDNLDSSVDVSVTENVIRNNMMRIYVLTDDAGNRTELQLEVNHSKHQIKAKLIGIKYNDKSVALTVNSLKIEYIIEDGNIKMLNQSLIIGDTKVHLIYNRNKDQTRIMVNGTQQVEGGLILMILRTNKGNLHYLLEEMRL
jgi:hypothetical protein